VDKPDKHEVGSSTLPWSIENTQSAALLRVFFISWVFQSVWFKQL
jgi:hypothetical protein